MVVTSVSSGTVVAEEALVETRLNGLVLVSSGARPFAALAFDGETIHQQLEGRFDALSDSQRLLALADGVPIITDSPRRAFDALARAGGQAPIVWDVLELAALLAPACPSGGLDRATAFFGIVVDGGGLLAQAQRALMLFQLLVATLDRTDTQTLLHVTRLAAGLDWPLRVLFAEMQRRRALSPLETGALAAGSPIGAWVDPRRAGPPPPREPARTRDHAARSGRDRSAPGAQRRHRACAQRLRAARRAGAHGAARGRSAQRRRPAAASRRARARARAWPTCCRRRCRRVKNQRRVVVSTATTTLQDQLFEQDLPLVQAGAGRPRQPLRATVLKGRGNYLCLRRWQTLLHARRPDARPIACC